MKLVEAKRSIHPAAHNPAQLELKPTEHMEHMEVATCLLLKYVELGLGQHRRHALQQAVQIRLQPFLETNRIVKSAVQLVQLLVLKLIATGLHMEIVFRGKDLELEPGPLFKQIVQLTAPQHLMKLVVQNLNLHPVVPLDAQPVQEPMGLGVLTETAFKERGPG